ncbi:hypothetical protein CUT44_18360 [Streptomyces carminius]|uniref:Uncharacterized protein n=1 Tax=Streptomyces carminius TaxID=2665496 RepID=A0A2M8LWX7_9ACTN|nr:hypothetical protein CUT44_18360 [Streptomyces carminius]
MTVAALLNRECAGRGGPEDDPVVRRLATLRGAYTGAGTTFGTWTTWLDGLGALPPDPLETVSGLRDALADRPGAPGIVGRLDALRDERNRSAHGDRPRSRQEAAARVAGQLPHLEGALERARFLADLPWLLTVRCAYRPRTRTYDVEAGHVMGDHPDFERRTFTLGEPVGDDMLYLHTPDGPVPLSPFASTGFCAQCGRVEVCYAHRAAKRGGPAILKGFNTGHDIPAPELDEELRALPERARGGRR